MKTPWSTLLHYGTAFAAFTVIVISGIILLAAIAVGIVLVKLSVFIK